MSDDRAHLFARGQMWGRMLDGIEEAKIALRGAAGDADELLTPEATKLLTELYNTTAALHQAAWEQYHEAHRQLLLARGRKKR